MPVYRSKPPDGAPGASPDAGEASPETSSDKKKAASAPDPAPDKKKGRADRDKGKKKKAPPSPHKPIHDASRLIAEAEGKRARATELFALAAVAGATATKAEQKQIEAEAAIGTAASEEEKQRLTIEAARKGLEAEQLRAKADEATEESENAEKRAKEAERLASEAATIAGIRAKFGPDSAPADASTAEPAPAEPAPPVEPTRTERAKAVKGYLSRVRERYDAKVKKQNDWLEKHPFAALGLTVPLSAPPRIMSWTLKKADHLLDWALNKLEGWGDKNAPAWFKWGFDWAAWPIEGWTPLGRQTDTQATVDAKEARDEKKEVAKMTKDKK